MYWTIVFIQDQSVQSYKNVLDTEFMLYNKVGFRNTVIDCESEFRPIMNCTDIRRQTARSCNRRRGTTHVPL